MENEKRLFDSLDQIPQADLRKILTGLYLLGSACCACQEHQKAQAEERQQNEDIAAIRGMLEELRQDQQRQAAAIQQERDAWASKRASYEKRLSDLDAEVEKKDQALQKVGAQMEALKQDHVQAVARLQKEGEDALAKLQAEYGEIQPVLNVYQRYKSWVAENGSRIRLNALDYSSCAAFIACCGQKWVLGYIFDELASVLWNWKAEDVAVLNEVIDYCCTLQGLERAHPEGDRYDPALHRKQEDAPAIGTIVNVLLRGVIKDGRILEDCQSFVELGA